MMRKWFHIACLLLVLHGLFASCVKEAEEGTAFREDVPVDLALHFGPSDAADITVTTKSTLGIEQESRVNNLYIFIFDAGGKKLYGHFFDGSNFGADAEGNWWEVSNLSQVTGVTQTSGTIHLRTFTKHDCTIVGIANINVNMLDLSPGQLSTVQSLSRLEQLKVGLNHLDIENSGFFLMTGRMDDVDIVKDDEAAEQKISGSLVLRRLESKILQRQRRSTWCCHQLEWKCHHRYKPPGRKCGDSESWREIGESHSEVSRKTHRHSAAR